ncbi:type 2 peptidyl-tRNA hydrolase [Encephalitozoon intestinalis ATCC 50506]|uniref:peptidyl-tRNA hydrolase n=1 Tax=Encephalitozoon intestinalis (strain ATCC 50506) TaxID=876142 RepID=E0S6M1_ENCIT|nr:type 2 peptidyl-tRNA hydrolase [Encephalitozoon intestinalis ATCC 50506]ADM11356.1 type 2 peptidyl-tRNA hydrolase [Encephalitozoon intestinalis ATCC 50506]UTX45046.1 type 2 peptidyl-tRNA hydrolase [Encephalitozoon intestinalis]
MEIPVEIASNFWKIAFFLLVLYVVLEKRPRIRTKKPVEKGEYGMNIIINKDYNMTKGKVISQICHGMASVMEHLFRNKELFLEWKRNQEPKIVLKASGGEIEEIIRLAKKNGVYYHKIHDAGRTQVPSGANTVLMLGPALRYKLLSISGHLKLY